MLEPFYVIFASNRKNKLNVDFSLNAQYTVLKQYLKLRERHAELSRKNADSRKFAICEQVNHLRHLGDILVTEPSNAKKLQKKAKRGKDKNGKEKHRKRFGKSIQNRCPGAFQSRLKAKFLSTGGEYHEVPSMFRASQYDHTNQQYVKKTLGTRLYHLSDGTQDTMCMIAHIFHIYLYF